MMIFEKGGIVMFFEKIITALQVTMKEPEPFGIYHILALMIAFVCVAICSYISSWKSEKQLKYVLAIYSIPTLLLEVIKQIIWSISFTNGDIFIDYPWYIFPFQLCTTPMIVSIICLFLNKCKLRDYLLSYVAFITILGSIAVMITPADCFVQDVMINIHTTYLHFGSFVVSCYLIISGEIKATFNCFYKAVITFCVFVAIATTLNIGMFKADILNGETFNMFYISPYFTSTLPIFDKIQLAVPYPLFLMSYVIALSLGGLAILGCAYGLFKMKQKYGSVSKYIAKAKVKR